MYTVQCLLHNVGRPLKYNSMPCSVAVSFFELYTRTCFETKQNKIERILGSRYLEIKQHTRTVMISILNENVLFLPLLIFIVIIFFNWATVIKHFNCLLAFIFHSSHKINSFCPSSTVRISVRKTSLACSVYPLFISFFWGFFFALSFKQSHLFRELDFFSLITSFDCSKLLHNIFFTFFPFNVHFHFYWAKYHYKWRIRKKNMTMRQKQHAYHHLSGYGRKIIYEAHRSHDQQKLNENWKISIQHSSKLFRLLLVLVPLSLSLRNNYECCTLAKPYSSELIFLYSVLPCYS